MKIKALCAFAGKISMSKGEVIEYDDPAVLEDLISAHYVEQVLQTNVPKKACKKKAVVANENK